VFVGHVEFEGKTGINDKVKFLILSSNRQNIKAENMRYISWLMRER